MTAFMPAMNRRHFPQDLAAAIAGKSEGSMMNQTGHRSSASLRRYIRDGNLFRDNAAEGLGL